MRNERTEGMERRKGEWGKGRKEGGGIELNIPENKFEEGGGTERKRSNEGREAGYAEEEG